MNDLRLRTLVLTGVLCTATSGPTFVCADDVPADEATPPNVPTTTSADEDDDALLRKLLGDPLPGDPSTTEPSTTDPATPVDPRKALAATVDRMRQAGRRIGDERDTGDETRGLQQRAVDDLAMLLELAKQQQRRQSAGQPPPPAGGTPPKPEEEPAAGDPTAGPQPMPEEGGDPMPGEDPGDRRRDDDSDATESADVTAQREQREAELAEQRRLVKDVWGHLPPAVRERMLNAYTDQPLPKYETLVPAYFRALAERSRVNDPGAEPQE